MVHLWDARELRRSWARCRAGGRRHREVILPTNRQQIEDQFSNEKKMLDCPIRS